MIVARRKESEYFETSPDYGHLANKMGSVYLAKLLSQVCFSESCFLPFFYEITCCFHHANYFVAFGVGN